MQPTWILVADSARARLFSVERPRGPLAEEAGYVNPADRLRDQDLESDASGRAGHHAYNSDRSSKADHADRFARELADVLNRGRQDGSFARLHLMAAPSFLGALRRMLDGPTSACVVGSYAKDVVRQRPDGIRRHLPYRL